MKNILLDIDGVIANFYAGFGQHLNDKLGAGLNVSTDPPEYSLHKWGHSIENSLVDAEIPKWIISGGYKNMPIYPQATEFVNDLNSRYNVHIVTARIGDFKINISEEVQSIIKADTYTWLKNNGIPSENLVFEHKKLDFCKEHNIPLLIEDKLSTVVDASKEGFQSILVNRGWNQEGEENLSRQHQGIHVAYGYDDILNLAKEILSA